MPEEYKVKNANWGPVKTLLGYTDCSFTATIDNERVDDHYNPHMTRNAFDGSIKSVVTIQFRGAIRCFRVECCRPGFTGMHGTAYTR